MDKCSGQAETLFHSPAERVDLGFAAFSEVNQLQQLGRDPPAAAAGHAMASGIELEVLLSGQPVVDAEEVGHVADQRPHRCRVLADRDAADRGPTSIRRCQGGEDADGGGLAGSVGPDEAEDLALGHAEADIRHRDLAAVPLAQLLDSDHPPAVPLTI